MLARILIAEDDPRQAEIVRRYLQAAGWDPVVVGDGRAAITAVRHRVPDLLVLDVLMPAIDGRDVCRVLRVDYDLPILMLTARSSADDRVLGLELGADDYLSKPYDPRELVARVRALLRRASPRPAVETARLADGDVIDMRRAENGRKRAAKKSKGDIAIH